MPKKSRSRKSHLVGRAASNQRYYTANKPRLAGAKARAYRRDAERRALVKAAAFVRMYVRRGLLVKPSGCDRCGGPGPEPFHPDPGDRYAFAWFCPACRAATLAEALVADFPALQISWAWGSRFAGQRPARDPARVPIVRQAPEERVFGSSAEPRAPAKTAEDLRREEVERLASLDASLEERGDDMRWIDDLNARISEMTGRHRGKSQ